MPSRILIADDYEDNRELLRLILVTAEYEVLEANDGQECLNLAQDHLPDLIMVDLAMPKLDGWEVFRALKADQRTSSIPCVVVSGYTELEPKSPDGVGFNAYLTKPFRTDEVLATVEGLLASCGTKVTTAKAGIASGD
jgi:CheY-like chemotaxis protein